MKIVNHGQHHYFEGNSYPVKEELKAGGCKWSADRKMWGLPDSTREQAQLLLDSLPAVEEKPKETVQTDTKSIIGICEYKGRKYGMLESRANPDGSVAAKICFKDGSVVFWTAKAEVQAGNVKLEYFDDGLVRSLDELSI